MFATAIRECLCWAGVAGWFFLTGWALEATIPKEAFRAAPLWAKAMIGILGLGLDLGFVLALVAAALAALWPLLPGTQAPARK